MDSSCGDLDVVAVPAVVGPRPVGGEIHGADGGCEAGATAAENVEIAPLEVVVAGSHQPAPRLQIRDPNTVAVGVVECEADDGVGSSLDDRPGSDVHRVHTIYLILLPIIKKKINRKSKSRGLYLK